MPVNRRNISTVVECAWRMARDATGQEENYKSGDDRVRNRNRSTAWVNALAHQFEQNYQLGERHRVFWKGSDKNKKNFRLNELLFDIVVCSVSTTESLQRQSIPLELITDSHWQIESEFAENTRDILVDMSKLVLGSAENKLMVASARDCRTEKRILQQCSEIASRCGSNVYFCFVAHPREWKNEPQAPTLYEWTAGDWEELQAAVR